MRILLLVLVILHIPVCVISQILEQDSLALVDLFNTTNGANWTNHSNWLVGPVAAWHGITVMGNRVVSIELSDNNLSGSIPPSIGNLDSLKELKFGINHLTGHIPIEFGNLINLQSLHLYNNRLNGSLPASLGNLSNLVDLNLGNNQFSGAIPSELGNLASLQVLWIDTNRLSGQIPAALGNLLNLEDISLANNQLSGQIPEELGNLSNLQDIYLSFNQLSGAIPSELGRITKLKKIEFQSNQLSGTLPWELGNLTELETLFLFANQLSGIVPEKFGELSKLQKLWIHGNRLDDLPDLSTIPNLVEMKIENNRFTFEDIEPNFGTAFLFTYSPQDSIGTEREITMSQGDPFTLSISVGGEHNLYQWYRNGKAIPDNLDSMMTIPEISLADSGTYTCEVTNSIATALTLYSRPVHVKILENPAIYVSCDTVQIAGNEFWLDINVGTEMLPVEDLFGASFVLHFDSPYIDIASPHSEHVIPGDFLGDTTRIVFDSPDLPGDSINVGISRKAGDENVSGSGTIVRAKFLVLPHTPDGTRIKFYFTAVTAKDSAWKSIRLSTKETYMTIRRSTVFVWPGDTNNDGIVNQADVLPIGLAMGFTGPDRPEASLKWIGQPCTAWIPERATYVDATGNGVVEFSDIVGIKMNWGKTISLKNSSLFSQIPAQDSLALLFPLCDSIQKAGSEFWLDIDVGTESQPVSNLYGVSFVLRYDGEYADVAPPFDKHVVPGDFFGDSSKVVFFSPELPGDSINIGISRTGSDVDVSGYGTVARVKFLTLHDTPDSTRIHFWIESIYANDVGWNPVDLTPGDAWITVLQDRLTVWPGDTNNDGFVNQVDVLPLGLSWGLTGPVRDDAVLTWSGQSCQTWNPVEATYADANGDGAVNESDVVPIGLNWGMTHGLAKSNLWTQVTDYHGKIYQTVNHTGDGENVFFVEIQVEQVSDLFGISFDLKYQNDFIDVISTKAGNCWSQDRLFYCNKNQSSNLISIALSQKSGQHGLNEDQTITLINFKCKTDHFNPEDLKFGIIDVIATNSQGKYFSMPVENETFNSNPAELPKNFQLYQNYPNPFNSETNIVYALPVECQVSISIINLIGQEVRELMNAKQNAGWYTIRWNGRNNADGLMPSGIYLVRMQADDYSDIQKMILAR